MISGKSYFSFNCSLEQHNTTIYQSCKIYQYNTEGAQKGRKCYTSKQIQNELAGVSICKIESYYTPLAEPSRGHTGSGPPWLRKINEELHIYLQV